MFLKRAGLFAGALLLLWLAVQFSSGSPQDTGHLYSDGSGTVVSKPSSMTQERQHDGLIRPGYVAAMLLLAGGAAFALHLRKRNPQGSAPHQPIQLIGKVQIAPTQHLRLVSCGGEVLLLGVSSSQITLLKTFPSDAFKESVSAGVALAETHPARTVDAEAALTGQYGRGFSDVLRHFTNGAAPQRLGEGA